MTRIALLLMLATSAAHAAETAKFAGSETCKACHEEIFTAFMKTPHEALEHNPKRGWANQACESCHGSGVKHAESVAPTDIFNPGRQTAGKFNKGCLACHANQKTPLGRIEGGHAADQIACNSCHTIHGNGPQAKGDSPLVVRAASKINEQCTGCHVSTWASFQRPFKHRLPEGAMSCVSCHNPHATQRQQTQRASFGNEPGCVACHSDKRGPFTFEHSPVRSEGCSSCHEPHGSANPKMLVRHEVRFTCLECHANRPLPATNMQGNLGAVPPAFHDLRSTRYQNCTICHTKTHGSYTNRAFLR